MKLKTIFAIGAIGLTALSFGCGANPENYSKEIELDGYPTEFGVNSKGNRFIRMRGGYSNRGFRPATLYAEDTDPDNPGFERIELTDPKDLSGIEIKNPLKKYAYPHGCEWLYDMVRLKKELDYAEKRVYMEKELEALQKRKH